MRVKKKRTKKQLRASANENSYVVSLVLIKKVWKNVK